MSWGPAAQAHKAKAYVYHPRSFRCDPVAAASPRMILRVTPGHCLCHIPWWWLSRSVVSDSCDTMDCSLSGASAHGLSKGRNIGMVSHFLLQGIFMTLG